MAYVVIHFIRMPSTGDDPWDSPSQEFGKRGRILLGLTLKQQLSTRLALMICLRRKLTVGKKSRVTGGGGIAMSRRFSTSTLLTRPKPFPSEARPVAPAAVHPPAKWTSSGKPALLSRMRFTHQAPLNLPASTATTRAAAAGPAPTFALSRATDRALCARPPALP